MDSLRVDADASAEADVGDKKGTEQTIIGRAGEQEWIGYTLIQSLQPKPMGKT